MGKPARARILADNQARAMATNIRISPRKLNLVAQSIRGLRAEVALNELSFSRKRIALSVKKVLQSAIANAENNHDLDVDDLIVSEASVGKNMVLKRFHARARGRGAAIQKPYSQITIVVEEKREPAKEEASTEGKSKGGKKRRSSNKTGKKSGGRKPAHKSASKAKKETA